MPQGWVRVWSFRNPFQPTVAYFNSYCAAVDFIREPISYGAEPGNYYIG